MVTNNDVAGHAKIVKLREIRHLFPAASWAAGTAPNIDDWDVLHVAGDAVAADLALDFGSDLPGALGLALDPTLARSVAVVLIEGDLAATRIYSHETDGSVGLVVLGNLEAEALAIGGQQTYVTGDLRARDFIWGDYNHGELVVDGQTTTRVFIATDEYHFDTARPRIDATYVLVDGDESDACEPCEAFVAHGLFVAGAWADDDEDDGEGRWRQLLNRDQVVDLLAAGAPVLKDPIEIQPRAEREAAELRAVPTVFENADFQDEPGFESQGANFARLMAIVAADASPPEVYAKYGYDFTFQLRDPVTDDADKTDYIYAIHEAGLRYFIKPSAPVVSKPAWGAKLLGAFAKPLGGSAADNAAPPASMTALVRNEANEDYAHVFEEGVDPIFRQELRAIWTTLLTRAERGVHFKRQLEATVTPQKLLELLALPMVAGKYNDFWDDDLMGFWSGKQIYAFNRNGIRDVPGTIAVGRAIASSAEFDCEKFYLKLNDVAEPTSVELAYMSSQEDLTKDRYSGSSRRVPLLDWELYQKALRFWSDAEAAIRAENDRYLAAVGDLDGDDTPSVG